MDRLRSRWDWIVRNKFVTYVIVFTVGLLVFVVVMVCRHWGWIVTESGSTIIRNLGLVIGGLIAIGFGIWRGVVADRQARSSQDQAKAALHQAETSQRGLLNERYQKGAEMLGSEVLSVRLGGIYALQSLAEDEPEQYHFQIMRLFCAFVRYPTADNTRPTVTERISKRVREDVQDAMTAIGNRSDTDIALEKKENFRLDLSGAYLVNVQLSDANLSNMVMVDTNLRDANLRNTDLSNVGLGGVSETVGLIQFQLDIACADPENPPRMDGLCDAETGNPLRWRGPPCRK